MAATPRKQLTWKHSCYAVACRELLARLPSLQTATRHGERGLDLNRSVSLFDQALADFFTTSPASLAKAAAGLAVQLQARASLMEHNEKAVQVFIDVAAAVQQSPREDSLLTDIDGFHDTGRLLAQSFFEAAPFPDIRAQFPRRCTLTLEPVTEEDRLAPFGAAAAPAAFRGSNRPAPGSGNDPDDIVVRIGARPNFVQYLSYPFVFLHEYTAHVYARDYKSDLFNDGWMIHAAAMFLQRESSRLCQQFQLKPRQARVYRDHLLAQIRQGLPARGCLVASEVEELLRDIDPTGQRFRNLTYELAALELGPGDSPLWHSDCLFALEERLVGASADPDLLRDALRQARDVRDLLRRIS